MNLYLDAKNVLYDKDYKMNEECYQMCKELKTYGIDIFAYFGSDFKEKVLIDLDIIPCSEIDYDLDEFEIFVSGNEKLLIKHDMDVSVLFRDKPTLENCKTNPNNEIYICKSFSDIKDLVLCYYKGEIE